MTASNDKTPPFHLAFPVDDLAQAEHFYGTLLACPIGRRDTHWIDFNFFGHQIVTHLVETMPTETAFNKVDGKQVPARHFGAVLNKTAWQSLAQRLEEADTRFLIKPYIRFEGAPGEQGTFFVSDPAGNALEFKYFDDMTMLFASDKKPDRC